MSITTDKYAETTVNTESYDVFSETLRSLRISGSILFNEYYAQPWAISIPDASKLKKILNLNSGTHVVAFHYVKRGYIEIALDTGNKIALEAGELAICFGGNAHQISQGLPSSALSVETLLRGMKNPFMPDEQHRVRSTSLICGLFLLQNIELNPLLASLPPLLHLSTHHQNPSKNLEGVLNQLNLEMENKSLGSTFVIERLLELLCAEAIRLQLESKVALTSGWLSSLKDPIVGRAIAMIHARPGDSWSVDQLAGNVAMSPSRFAARFTDAIGDSPMSYVAKWRMNVAGRLLKGSQQAIEEIANNVGYENVAAFNRAFKKHLGLPPAAWRTRV